MKNTQKLKTIFAKYAGKKIKDPNRMTCDCDPVMDALANEVHQAGYVFGTPHKKGSSVKNNGSSNIVSAEIKDLHLTGKFKLR